MQIHRRSVRSVLQGGTTTRPTQCHAQNALVATLAGARALRASNVKQEPTPSTVLARALDVLLATCPRSPANARAPHVKLAASAAYCRTSAWSARQDHSPTRLRAWRPPVAPYARSAITRPTLLWLARSAPVVLSPTRSMLPARSPAPSVRQVDIRPHLQWHARIAILVASSRRQARVLRLSALAARLASTSVPLARQTPLSARPACLVMSPTLSRMKQAQAAPHVRQGTSPPRPRSVVRLARRACSAAVATVHASSAPQAQ